MVCSNEQQFKPSSNPQHSLLMGIGIAGRPLALEAEYFYSPPGSSPSVPPGGAVRCAAISSWFETALMARFRPRRCILQYRFVSLHIMPETELQLAYCVFFVLLPLKASETLGNAVVWCIWASTLQYIPV